MQDTQSDIASQNDDTTPETDKLYSRMWWTPDTETMTDHARKLERERNLAKGQAIYWQDKATQFEQERDELLAALESLLRFTPSLKCEHFHHSLKDQHGDFDDCPPLTLFNDAIERAIEVGQRIKGGAA